MFWLRRPMWFSNFPEGTMTFQDGDHFVIFLKKRLTPWQRIVLAYAAAKFILFR